MRLREWAGKLVKIQLFTVHFWIKLLIRSSLVLEQTRCVTPYRRMRLNELLTFKSYLRGPSPKFWSNVVFFVFLFIGENLSLGSCWSHVKRLWACEHENPPKMGGMHVLYLFICSICQNFDGVFLSFLFSRNQVY